MLPILIKQLALKSLKIQLNFTDYHQLDNLRRKRLQVEKPSSVMKQQGHFDNQV